MKSLKINKSLLLAISSLVLVFVIIFAPIIKMKFGWIDDGMDIMVAKNFLNAVNKLDFKTLSNILIERDLGLFRPVHWVWKSFVYVLAGNSSEIQYFLHSALILGTSVLIFQFVRYISKSNLGAFFAASLFLVIPVNIENWVRMGPQEPLMGFLMIASLYILFVYKKSSLALIILSLAFMTKVTVIAIVPAITIYYLVLRFYVKKESGLLIYVIGSWIICTFYLLVSFSIRTGYATYYEFNPVKSVAHFATLINILKASLPFGTIFLATFILRNFYPLLNNKIKNIDKSDFFELFFLMLFGFFVVIQSPWIFILNRYFLPMTIAASVFLGVELANILKIFHGKHRKVYIVVLILFLGYYSIYLTNNLVKAGGVVMWWVHYNRDDQLMFKYLAENTPKGGKVFINFQKNDATYEPILETGWNLNLFYDRGDIQVKSIEDKAALDKNYILVSNPVVMGSWAVFSETELANMKNFTKTESFEVSDRYIVFSNIDTIVKQVAKKSLGLILHHKKLNPEGIYTYYYLRDRWTFYYEN